jgi:hypothetical protein
MNQALKLKTLNDELLAYLKDIALDAKQNPPLLAFCFNGCRV